MIYNYKVILPQIVHDFNTSKRLKSLEKHKFYEKPIYLETPYLRILETLKCLEKTQEQSKANLP